MNTSISIDFYGNGQSTNRGSSRRVGICFAIVNRATGGIDLFFFVLFGVNRPAREFFTHIETSPLPRKGCKC